MAQFRHRYTDVFNLHDRFFYIDRLLLAYFFFFRPAIINQFLARFRYFLLISFENIIHVRNIYCIRLINIMIICYEKFSYSLFHYFKKIGKCCISDFFHVFIIFKKRKLRLFSDIISNSLLLWKTISI